MAASEYFGLLDLAARWNYTRQGVYKLSEVEDFPAPAFVVNQRVRVWHLDAVKVFEAVHPEVTSEAAKHRKMMGRYLAGG